VSVANVADDGIPGIIDFESGQAIGQAHNGKRFKIFVVPSREEGFEAYRFQLIGQGASFCTAQNCGTAHHHASVKNVIPGNIFVAKSTSTASTTPTISKTLIKEDVLSVWRTLTL
jgi:hypothetical protein